MHGFVKLHKRPKKDLMEVLSTMKLLNPQRSTLDAKILPYGSWPTTVDQVNQDLDDLGWQECAVQSVETLDRTREEACHFTNTNDCDLPMDFSVTVKKPRSKKRKRRMRFDFTDTNMEYDDGGADVDGISAIDCVAGDVDSLLDQLSSGPFA
uniref:DUF7787 domain-containing protein n=2 Tax=Davidia involucrata TaxID=16924 RepID=A0A5B6YNT1_DAVIN